MRNYATTMRKLILIISCSCHTLMRNVWECMARFSSVSHMSIIHFSFASHALHVYRSSLVHVSYVSHMSSIMYLIRFPHVSHAFLIQLSHCLRNFSMFNVLLICLSYVSHMHFIGFS